MLYAHDFTWFRTPEDNEEKYTTTEASRQARAWGKTDLAGIPAHSLRSSSSRYTSLLPFEAWSLLSGKGTGIPTWWEDRTGSHSLIAHGRDCEDHRQLVRYGSAQSGGDRHVGGGVFHSREKVPFASSAPQAGKQDQRRASWRTLSFTQGLKSPDSLDLWFVVSRL